MRYLSNQPQQLQPHTLIIILRGGRRGGGVGDVMWNAADQLFNSFPRVKSSGAIYTIYYSKIAARKALRKSSSFSTRALFRVSVIFLDRKL
jgi:hypothetical protein